MTPKHPSCDLSVCGRPMVGSGMDTYDPTCELPEGHGGSCKSSSAIDQHRLLVKIVFLDKPDDYPRQPRSASRMVEAPERLRVALHRQALGVYDILGPDDRPLQESLWREVTYWRASHRGDVAEYSVRAQEGADG